MSISIKADSAHRAMPKSSNESLGSSMNSIAGIYIEAMAKNIEIIGSFAEYIKGFLFDGFIS